MGCFCTKQKIKREDPAILASQTYFTGTQIGGLRELFEKLSSSLIDDGFISKEEFQVGLFGNSKKQSPLSDRIFELFDEKQDGLIDFGEFVRSLSIFHPEASQSEKIDFSFRLYDMRQTGFIEYQEVKKLITALMEESDLILSDDIIEGIIDKTFEDADTKKDGKIDLEEWEQFVTRNPSLINYTTIPYLKDTITAIPSFVKRKETYVLGCE